MSNSKGMYVKDLGDGFKTVEGNFEPDNPEGWEEFEDKSKFIQRVRELEEKYR